MGDIVKKEYMCSYCGKKEIKLDYEGRPIPNRCGRRNGNLPHRWIVNRTYKNGRWG